MSSPQSQVPNFCRKESMYICAAGEDADRQKRCRFYRKASRSGFCMHYRASLGGHCDSVDAQLAAQS